MRTGALAMLLVFALAGCGGGGNHPGCPSSQGIVLLSWTVRGQAATTQSCGTIDHLTLTMNSGCGQLSIDPIPCIQGAHWEYDHLPEGNAGVILDAVDARGVLLAQGYGSVTLTAQKPSAPTPIDLN